MATVALRNRQLYTGGGRCVQRDVTLATGGFGVVVGLLDGGWRHGGLLETVVDDIDSQGAGMGHVGTKETVVAQLVQNNLVGGEIMATGGQLFDGQKEGGLAELVAVSAVGHVADRGDCEDSCEFGVVSSEFFEEGLPEGDYLVDGHTAAGEHLRRELVAVGDYFSG